MRGVPRQTESAMLQAVQKLQLERAICEVRGGLDGITLDAVMAVDGLSLNIGGRTGKAKGTRATKRRIFDLVQKGFDGFGELPASAVQSPPESTELVEQLSDVERCAIIGVDQVIKNLTEYRDGQKSGFSAYFYIEDELHSRTHDLFVKASGLEPVPDKPGRFSTRLGVDLFMAFSALPPTEGLTSSAPSFDVVYASTQHDPVYLQISSAAGA